LKDNKISDDFLVKIKNFYDSTETIYSSFDKWIKDIYDKEMMKILDEEVNYLNTVWNFVVWLRCKINKFIKLENLSRVCG
jgi:hypothetical protein